MTPREELAALRRLAELEARAGGAARQQVEGDAITLAAQNPAGDMSASNQALAGFGKAFSDLGSGAAQLIGMGPKAEEVADARKRDASLMGTGAGLVGNIAGNVAATLPTLAIPGINTYTGAASLGTILGALQPAQSRGERLGSALIGAGAGAAGQGVGNLVGRAIRPVQSTLNPEAQRLAAAALREGIPLDAAAKTGSKPLQIANAVFENLPFTAGPQAAQVQARQQAFTTAALKRAGINARGATPGVLGTQKQALGKQFEAIAGRNQLNFNQGLAYDISRIADTASRRLPNQGTQITNTVQDILAEAPNGLMEGTKYQGWRSELGRLARGTDADAHYFGQIKKALDKEFGAQISTADAQGWKQASREYANLKTILDSMGGAGNAANTGNIAPAQLAAALQRSVGKEGKALGRGDLNDLTRIGQVFVKDQIPNSGTAQRAIYQSLLTGGGGAGLGAGGALATGNDPINGAVYGAATTGTALALPLLIQKLLQNAPMQNYMVQRAVSPAAKALAAILQGAGRTAGAVAPIEMQPAVRMDAIRSE